MRVRFISAELEAGEGLQSKKSIAVGASVAHNSKLTILEVKDHR